MTEEHSSLIKTPKQLVIVVLLAFAVPIALAAMLSQLVTSGEKGSHENEALVLARIQPVGNVLIAAPSGSKGMLTGDQVYGQVCKTCHETGLAGAPKFGDKAAWAKVLAEGDKLAFTRAIGGYNAMPPKGGNSDLTDDEVKRAVVFMTSKVGANWTAPPVAAPAPAAATAAAPAAPARRDSGSRNGRLCCARGARRGCSSGCRRRQEGLRRRLYRVPRRGRRRRTQVRRQGPPGRRVSRRAWTRCTTPRSMAWASCRPRAGIPRSPMPTSRLP